MKIIIAMLVALSFSSTVLAEGVEGHPVSSTQRTYFDSKGQVIGESIGYCSGNTQHWGEASSSSTNYVEADYGCEAPSIQVTFASGTSAETRRTACGDLALCIQPQPWPTGGQGKGDLTPGLYSN